MRWHTLRHFGLFFQRLWQYSNARITSRLAGQQGRNVALCCLSITGVSTMPAQAPRCSIFSEFASGEDVLTQSWVKHFYLHGE